MEGVRILTSDVQARPLWRKAPLFMDAIKFHESVFALPFAYMGMTLAADGFPGWRTFAWITVAMVSARTVGMSANRVIDRHIDARNPRSADRHLPRGLLSAPEMSGLTVVSFGVFLFAAWQLNTLALILAPVAAAYLVLYPYSKRFTWAANLLLGWALAISPSAAWIGVTGSLSPEPVLLSLAVALWAGSFDILYHTQDYEFHRQSGLHSIAARFGIVNAFRIAKVMDAYWRWSACGLLGVWMGLDWPFFAGCGVACAVLAYKYVLVSPDDLSKMGVAFGRINAYVSVTMLAGYDLGGVLGMNTSESDDRPVVVGITGASGAVLAQHTIDALLQEGVPVIASASRAARMVWSQEMSESFGAAMERWDDSGAFVYHSPSELAAPIASGTFPTRGMVIVPCSMATAAAVANGLSDNLIRRAADVTIKERRPLVVVPRESPLSAIHLRNLTTLAEVGATVIPPEPAFYLGQQTIDDVAEFVAQRALLALGVRSELPEGLRYEGMI